MPLQRSQNRFAVILLGCALIAFPLGETGFCECEAASLAASLACGTSATNLSHQTEQPRGQPRGQPSGQQTEEESGSSNKDHACCHHPRQAPPNGGQNCQAKATLGKCCCSQHSQTPVAPAERVIVAKAPVVISYLADLEAQEAQMVPVPRPTMVPLESSADSHNQRQASLSVWRK